MRKVVLIFFLYTVILFGQVDIKSSISPENGFIGDKFTVEFMITFDRNTEIDFPSLDNTKINNVHILNKKIKTERHSDEFKNIYEFEITTFDTAWQAFPALQIAFRDTAFTKEWSYIYSDSVHFFIFSALDSIDTILEQYSPVSIFAFSAKQWLILALIIIILIILLRIIFSKRNYKKDDFIIEKELSPSEKALIALEELDEKQYPLKGLYKEFYLELTQILKQYYELIYFIHLLELSTTETLELMKQKLSEHDYNSVKQFFQNSDLIKFAKQDAAVSQCQSDLEWLKKLVSSE